MKAWKIIVGVLLIAVAALLILEAVGVINPLTGIVGEISFWQAVGGISLGAGIVALLSWGQFWQIFVLLGFLFMIFERNVAYVCGAAGDDIINNWLVFGCSLLLSVGFAFIFSGRKKKKKAVVINKSGNKMGATSMYIDCTEFGTVETERCIQNKLGAVEVHFENPENYVGGATLWVEDLIGAIEIRVPKSWRVDCEGVDLSLGVIDWDKNGENGEGPLLIIKGNVKLGAVDVERV